MHEQGIVGASAAELPSDLFKDGIVGLCKFFLERKPGVAMKRNLLSEWFFIEQGKIRSIYASMFYPEQEAIAPNWAPFDGNWPVAPPAK